MGCLASRALEARYAAEPLQKSSMMRTKSWNTWLITEDYIALDVCCTSWCARWAMTGFQACDLMSDSAVKKTQTRATVLHSCQDVMPLAQSACVCRGEHRPPLAAPESPLTDSQPASRAPGTGGRVAQLSISLLLNLDTHGSLSQCDLDGALPTQGVLVPTEHAPEAARGGWGVSPLPVRGEPVTPLGSHM